VYEEGLRVLSWNSRVRTDENHGTPGYKVHDNTFQNTAGTRKLERTVLLTHHTAHQPTCDFHLFEDFKMPSTRKVLEYNEGVDEAKKWPRV
jgi:hypothetical protein